MKQFEKSFEVREFYVTTHQEKTNNQPKVLKVSYLLVDSNHKFNDKHFDTNKTKQFDEKLKNFTALHPVQFCEKIIMNNKKVGYFIDQLFIEA